MTNFNTYIRKKKHQWKLFKEILNHDWDYGYIYTILRTKLENVLDYAENDSVVDIDHWHIDKLKICINLCKKLSGKVTEYPAHINMNNINRFVHKDYQWCYGITDCRDTVITTIDDDINLSIMAEEKKRCHQELFYDVKAKHLLFNLLCNYIEYWWD